MKVLIDSQPLLQTKTGIGYYCYNLVNTLQRIQSGDEFVALYNKSKMPPKGVHVRGEELHIKYPYKGIRNIMGPRLLYNIPLEKFAGGFDVYHGTNFAIVPTAKAATVITIHDMAFKLFPETIGRSNLRYLTNWLKYMVTKSTKVIAVSKNTKKDITNFLNIDPGKIHVTPLAADSIYRPISEDDSYMDVVREKYALPNKFILYLGMLEPRKNLTALIEAYKLVSDRTGCEHKLVLAGKAGWLCDSIYEKIQVLNLSAKVIFTGYVDLHDLPYFYNLATVFAYVSKYEGFGLPPLEAMQCGTPVVVSNVASLPEVVGDAGLFVEQNDVNDIAMGIEKVLESQALQKILRQKGIRRAAEFNWKATAQKTIECYRAAAEERDLRLGKSS
ncbi:glycosyltransferase family 1 protein [Sporomusa sp. KB1]|uniref:glycosyltransferase family 4 protein n=1 Tax=Sporomusa sp. KB1 TaxID=943346 RepID=UPI0011AC36E5|nr:glycosyltransferase family 1 protein [Sporomusa sp. KB1]TWH45103.1 glycosyltransferase involved in cell wall biosynthesis [Sporomusa sp. KB1]